MKTKDNQEQSFNTTANVEQTGIRKVLSNVIAFRSASSPIDVESLAMALAEGLLAAKSDGGTYDPREPTRSHPSTTRTSTSSAFLDTSFASRAFRASSV